MFALTPDGSPLQTQSSRDWRLLAVQVQPPAQAPVCIHGLYVCVNGSVCM